MFVKCFACLLDINTGRHTLIDLCVLPEKGIEGSGLRSPVNGMDAPDCFVSTADATPNSNVPAAHH